MDTKHTVLKILVLNILVNVLALPSSNACLQTKCVNAKFNRTGRSKYSCVNNLAHSLRLKYNSTSFNEALPAASAYNQKIFSDTLPKICQNKDEFSGPYFSV